MCVIDFFFPPKAHQATTVLASHIRCVLACHIRCVDSYASPSLPTSYGELPPLGIGYIDIGIGRYQYQFSATLGIGTACPLAATSQCVYVLVRPVFVWPVFVTTFFVQSILSNPIRLGLDEMDWTKTGWSKRNWTKSRSTVHRSRKPSHQQGGFKITKIRQKTSESWLGQGRRSFPTIGPRQCANYHL